MVLRTPDGELVVGAAADNLAGVHPDRVERTPKRSLGSGGAAAARWRADRSARRRRGGDADDRRRGPAPPRASDPRELRPHPPRPLGRRPPRRARRGRRSAPDSARCTSSTSRSRPRSTTPPSTCSSARTSASTTSAAARSTRPLLQRTERGFEVIGVPGGDEDIGGENFDHRLFRYFGSCLAETTPELWEQMLTSDDRKWKRAALDLLVQARRAKEALSSYTSTQVFVPVADRDIVVNRSQFEAMIIDDIERTVDLMEDTVVDAGLQDRRSRRGVPRRRVVARPARRADGDGAVRVQRRHPRRTEGRGRARRRPPRRAAFPRAPSPRAAAGADAAAATGADAWLDRCRPPEHRPRRADAATAVAGIPTLAHAPATAWLADATRPSSATARRSTRRCAAVGRAPRSPATVRRRRCESCRLPASGAAPVVRPPSRARPGGPARTAAAGRRAPPTPAHAAGCVTVASPGAVCAAGARSARRRRRVAAAARRVARAARRRSRRDRVRRPRRRRALRRSAHGRRCAGEQSARRGRRGPPRRSPTDSSCVGTLDGRVVALDRRTGRGPLADLASARPVAARRSSSAASSSSATTAVGCSASTAPRAPSAGSSRSARPSAPDIVAAGPTVRRRPRRPVRCSSIDADTGRPRGATAPAGQVLLAPGVVGDRVLVPSRDGIVYGLRLSDGVAVYGDPLPGAPATPVAIGGGVFARDRRGAACCGSTAPTPAGRARESTVAGAPGGRAGARRRRSAPTRGDRRDRRRAAGRDRPADPGLRASPCPPATGNRIGPVLSGGLVVRRHHLRAALRHRRAVELPDVSPAGWACSSARPSRLNGSRTEVERLEHAGRRSSSASGAARRSDAATSPACTRRCRSSVLAVGESLGDDHRVVGVGPRILELLDAGSPRRRRRGSRDR